MACPVRQLQEQSKRIREGGGLSHSAAARSGEVLDQTVIGKGQSIMTPYRLPWEMQALKTVEFEGLHQLSFPIPHPCLWNVRRWHLFYFDPQRRGMGRRGHAVLWLYWDNRRDPLESL